MEGEASRSGRRPAMERVLIGVSSQLNNMAMLVISLMMLHVTADVASKYLFNAPIEGTLETVSLYYMVAVVFFPLAYSTHEGGQIRVELFTRNLSPRRQLYLDGFVSVFGFLYMALFAWQTCEEAISRTRSSEVRETAVSMIAVWPSRWILPISFVVMGLYFLCKGIEDIRRARAAS